MQVAARRAGAPAVLDDALHVADARLHRAVVVAVARDAHLHRALDEGVADRIAPVEVGDRQVALAAAEGLVGLADAALGPAEIGQHVGVAPAVVAALRPAVEIHALAAIVDMAVDRARTAQGLAARRGDAPAAGPFAGLRGVEPVHPRIDQRVHEAGGNMDERMPVPRPGLEHADADARVLAQAAGEHAAGRSGADDDVVEGFHQVLAIAASWSLSLPALAWQDIGEFPVFPAFPPVVFSEPPGNGGWVHRPIPSSPAPCAGRAAALRCR